MTLQVGSIVIARMATAVCEIGERGVVYEIYGRAYFGGEGSGAGVIFERGHYDGFSPDEQLQMLEPTGEICAAVAGYAFRNVIQLSHDFNRGVFAPAFRVPAVTSREEVEARR